MSTQYRFTIVGTDRTQKMFRSIKVGLAGVRTAINSTRVSMGLLAGAAGIGLLINQNRKLIDEMAKLSDRVNITTEDLAAYQLLVELNGDTQENFTKSIEKMTKSIGEAARGVGTGKEALADMGIEVSEIINLNAGQQFEVIARAISQYENQATQATLASDIFGRSGVKLLNTIREVDGGLEKARAEVEEYGLAISRVEAARVEEANDQLLRASRVMRGLGTQLTVDLAPLISVVADEFVQAATEGDRMGTIVTNAIGGALKVTGVFLDGIRGVKVIFAGVKIAAQGFGFAAVGAFKLITEGAIIAGQTIVDFITTPMRKALEVTAKFSDTAAEALAELNAITTIERPDFLDGVDRQLQGLAETVQNSKQELHDLLMADVPSAAIEQAWERIQAEAGARAEQTVAAIRERLASGTVDIEDELAAQDAREELAKERAKRLLAVQKSFEKSSLELTRFTEKQKAGVAKQGLATILGFQAGGSKKIFAVQKALSLAQAAVSVPAAVVESFKNAGGYPWGVVPAAIMAAKGAAQIASIKRQNIGSGGGVPSVSGGGAGSSGPAAPAVAAVTSGVGSQLNAQPEANQPQTIVNFNVAGDIVGETAEVVLTRIRELVETTDAVLIPPNTRQAAEIATAGAV